MADVTILQLPTLSPAAITGADVLPIVDVSDLTDPGGTTKGITTDGLTQYANTYNSLFNVKQYGAVGNGTTDDTVAIQAAITAASITGGIVFLPIGTYLVTSPLILTGGVSLQGSGLGYGSTPYTCKINWAGIGFCIKMGNTAGALSYGMNISNLSIGLTNTNSGVWIYGAAKSTIRNIDIEGIVGTTTSIGVQIDGANISCFFILMENVSCNHVFNGFVHTTTGSTKCTQVTGINCNAVCDNTIGSRGIDVQVVAGVGMGDGVTYLGGNMETCATGVHLNGGGTSIIGMRFENVQGVASDITFDTSARCNQVIGGSTIYTITNLGGATNQVICVPMNEVSPASQLNRLGPIVITGDNPIALTPDGANSLYYTTNASASYTGKTVMQAGQGSAGTGGAIHLYGHSNAIHPGDVVAGISSGSGGAFRVNSQGLDAGTNWLTVNSSGMTVTNQFGCNGATPQSSVASGGAAPAGGTGATAGAYDTAAHRDALITLVNTMRTALVANGIMT